MKPLILSLLLMMLALSCAQDKPVDNNANLTETVATEAGGSGFDSILAKELGADDYGMKQYVIAYLKRGPNRTDDKAAEAALQSAHMANINKMAEEGKLVLAGPFLEEDYDVRGIYIFNTPDVKTAEEWTNTDPAIKAGSLVMELHAWYGSAALMMVSDQHDKLAKINI